MSEVQVHHILPKAVFEEFARRIADWTGSTGESFNVNAGYNLVILPTSSTSSGTTLNPIKESPSHNGSHPGLNAAWKQVLTKIDNGPESDAVKGLKFKAANAYFKSTLDLLGSETVAKTFLNKDDPNYTGIANDEALTKYMVDTHTWDAIESSPIGQAVLQSTDPGNEVFGSEFADYKTYSDGAKYKIATGYDALNAEGNPTYAGDTYTGIDKNGFVIELKTGIQVNSNYFGKTTLEIVTNNLNESINSATSDIIASNGGVSDAPASVYENTLTSDIDTARTNLTPVNKFIDSESGALTLDEIGNSTRKLGQEIGRLLEDVKNSSTAAEAQTKINQVNSYLNDLDTKVQQAGAAIPGGRIISKLGTIGDAAELGLAVYTASQQVANGQYFDAAETMLEASSNLLVGIVAGAAGALLAAALVSNPIGWVGAAAIVVAGAAGGIAGGSLWEKFVLDANDGWVEDLLGSSDQDGARSTAKFIKVNQLDDLWENPFVSPLVLDLDDDGIELTALAGSATHFDLTVDGFAELTGWVAPDDALLAFDVNGNGVIDNGSELFGDQTGYDNGFLALAVHDDNGDGIINVQDAIFSELVVWQDLNGDGISAAIETQGLEDVGITSISLTATSSNYQIEGNDILWEGAFARADGTTGLIVDAFFDTDPIRTVVLLPDNFEYHPDVFRLPVLQGAGMLASTWVALSQDAFLRQEAIDLVALASTGDMNAFFPAFESFVLNWGGAGDIQAGSRGDYVNAKYVGFMENVLGQPFTGDLGSFNGVSRNADEINEKVNLLIRTMAIEFLSQVPISAALLTDVSADDFYAYISDNALSPLAPLADTVNDWYAGQDINLGTSTNDTLTADVAGGVLIGGGGNDTLTGSYQNDIFIYSKGSGSDTIIDRDYTQNWEVDRLIFSDISAYEASFSRNAGNDLVITLEDGETVTVVGHFDNGVEDVEVIEFADGTVLDSQDIRNKSLDDQKASGTVLGSKDVDNYRHTQGDGSYTIFDPYDGNYGNNVDTLTFTDVLADEVSFRNSSGNLTITLPNGEVVTVNDHFDSSGEDIEQIVFADGTVLSVQGILDKSVADQKASGSVAGSRYGENYTHAQGDGSYTIFDPHDGNYGNSVDTLTFTDLNPDNVSFSNNNGSLVISLPNSEIITLSSQFSSTSKDIEQIAFADGTVLSSQGIRDKSVADQKASGSVVGSRYGDNYVHADGDGSYTITDNTMTSWYSVDTLMFSDLNAGQVSFGQNDGRDLVLTTAGGDVITVKNQFYSSSYTIENIMFSDGTTFNLQDIRARTLEGGAGDDNLTGFDTDDVMYGNEGNDTINGSLGDDSQFGGAGDDLLIGNVGADFFDGGEGNDTLDFLYTSDDVAIDLAAETVTFSNGFVEQLVSIENIVAGSGNNVLIGDDGINLLDGGGGNDRLTGGQGSDVLTGGAGDDTFVFAGSFGQDIITDFSMSTNEVINLSGVIGVTSISDLTFVDSNGSTILRFDLDGDGMLDDDLSITISNQSLTAVDTDQFVF